MESQIYESQWQHDMYAMKAEGFDFCMLSQTSLRTVTGWSHLKSQGPHRPRETVVILRDVWIWCFANLAPKCVLVQQGRRGNRFPIVDWHLRLLCVLRIVSPLLVPFRSCSQHVVSSIVGLSGGGLSRLGRLRPGLQGAAGAAPSCPDLHRRLRWSSFLKLPPHLFIVLVPISPSTLHPLAPKDFFHFHFLLNAIHFVSSQSQNTAHSSPKLPIVSRQLCTSSDFHLHTPPRVFSSQILPTASTTATTPKSQHGSPDINSVCAVLELSPTINPLSSSRHLHRHALSSPRQKHKPSTMSPDKPSPAAAKQRIMGDLKQVSSEKWVRVDVCGSMASQRSVAHS